MNIKKITSQDIARYFSEIETTYKNGILVETSLSYRKQNHTVLNSLFSFLFDNEYIESNPMKKIKRATGKDNVNRIFLQDDDLKKILLAVDNGAGTVRQKNYQKKWKTRDKAILMLFMETGIRETALTEINVEDLNFTTNIIKVINKGHKPFDYKIDTKLSLLLQDWLYERNIILGNSQCDALFISTEKTRITCVAVSNLVKKYSYEALGYKISPHKLRASFANMVLRKTNGNIYMAQRLLDHASPNTTKIYLEDISLNDKEKITTLISNDIF